MTVNASLNASLPPPLPPLHPQFLDFFFSQFRRNDTGSFTEYPYFSPCGKEKNYIRPACVGVVFHDLQFDGVDGAGELIWGGGLRQRFEPSALAMSERTGRLYHRLFSTPGGENE